MKRLLGIAVLLAVASVGCGSEHGMFYTVEVDTSLSPDQVESVIQATEAWQAAIPGLELKVEINPCQGFGNSAHTICLFLDPGFAPGDSLGTVLATTDWSHSLWSESDSASADSATIHLWQNSLPIETLPNEFTKIVAHELDHAFCHNSEHLAGNHLMSAAVTLAPIESAITAEDIEYFWNAR
jgi:hypothetical protein